MDTKEIKQVPKGYLDTGELHLTCHKCGTKLQAGLTTEFDEQNRVIGWVESYYCTSDLCELSHIPAVKRKYNALTGEYEPIWK